MNPSPIDRRPSSLYEDIPCILAETSTLTTRNIECALYKWSPPNKNTPIRGVAVVYHGFGAHSLYPTVRYASSLLAENGLLVYGLDFPGHGASPGKRGLLTGVDDLIEDGVAVAIHAMVDSSNNKHLLGGGGGGSPNSNSKSSSSSSKQQQQQPGGDLPLFLVGSSMGGAIALSVANRMTPDTVSGVVMLAPMLSLSVGSTAKKALGWITAIAPTVPLIPSSATSPEMQYRDAERRAECARNTLTYKGAMR